MNDSIDPNLRAPETVLDFPAWNELLEIQLAPSMQTEAAAETL